MDGYDQRYRRARGESMWRDATRYGTEYERGGFGTGSGRGAYGDDFAGTGRERMMQRMRQTRGGYDRQFGGGPAAGYDRGVYGGAYPTFGGSPGGQRQGMYYGGAQSRGGRAEQSGGAGYGRDFGGTSARGGGWGGAAGGGTVGGGVAGGRYGAQYERAGGYGPQQGGRGGYDTQFARQPFLPDVAYRRHPELGQERAHRGVDWPRHEASQGAGAPRSDDEIEQEVRSNLYQDAYVDAERIDIQVEDGVVTLTGEVDDFLVARYAWDDAWEAGGVRGVINHITVRTDQETQSHGDVSPKSEVGKKGAR